MPRRILHLIGGGEIGGAEQHVLNLLTGLQEEKVQPTLVCLIANSPLAPVARSLGI